MARRPHRRLSSRHRGSEGFAPANPRMTGTTRRRPIQPQAPGAEATGIWWRFAGTRADRRVDGRAGYEPHELDAADGGHRCAFRMSCRPSRSRCTARRGARRGTLERRAYRWSRSILPIMDERDAVTTSACRRRAPRATRSACSTARSRAFGRSYIGGARPHRRRARAGCRRAGSRHRLLVTVPNQFGCRFLFT